MFFSFGSLSLNVHWLNLKTHLSNLDFSLYVTSILQFKFDTADVYCKVKLIWHLFVVKILAGKSLESESQSSIVAASEKVLVPGTEIDDSSSREELEVPEILSDDSQACLKHNVPAAFIKIMQTDPKLCE